MIDVNKLHSNVLEDIEENLKHIEHSSVEEAFDAYLTYNGIQGYTDQIIDALDNIRDAAGHGIAMDIFDQCWRILMKLNPEKLNMPYCMILASTGRQEELLKHLKEF